MLSMTQSTESKEKKEITRVNGRFQDTTPTTPENASWGKSGYRLSLAGGGT